MFRKRISQHTERNFEQTKWRDILPPFLILLSIFILFLSKVGEFKAIYPAIQKDLFLFLNNKLSAYPNFEYNITQLGDVLIMFPFVMILVYYSPKFWGALLNSSILSLIVSKGLKLLFSMPRPAAVYDTKSFTIIGKKLMSNSLPSGHSMSAFIVMSLILFAFMPQKNKLYKILWSIFIISIGLLIVSSRVGVGAHYPLDVLSGSCIGYILAIIGIKLNNKLKWWNWISKPKFLPIFIVLFFIWGIIIITKITKENLFIYELSLVAIMISIYVLIKQYVQKKIK